MKKHLILSLTLVGASTGFAAEVDNGKVRGDDVFGHTFFSVRPEFQTAFPENVTMFRDRAQARCDGSGGAFQFVAFGGRSTRGKELMKYFAPCPKTELVVDSDGTDTVGGVDLQTDISRDINPIHFGINTLDGATARYKSTIRFRPRRSVGGIGFSWKHYLGRDCNCEDKRWFVQLNVPIIHVRNKVRLEETIDTNVTTTRLGIQNMVEAFKGETNVLGTGTTMNFGRINDESKDGMSKTGTDIELIFGRDIYDDECVHIDGYFGFQIPGSKKPKGVYMFEAVPGFNQHFGFMLGGSTGVEIWRECDRSLSWEVATNSRFWVQNTQTRSFDLKGRKWSRYMLLVDTQNNNQLVPGINVLTRKVKVHPRYSLDINTGLVYDNDCGFRGEVGYNFYARQGERVRLKDEWEANRYAVAGLTGLNNNNNPSSTNQLNRVSNIGNNVQDADIAIAGNASIPNSTIRAEDLGLESAVAPCAISNLIYGSLGYHWDDRCYPLFVGLGGSYEFSGKNTALNRWLAWFKFGVSI